ncbi:MAG: sulfatase-like hydrolase/transferase [Planctomycetes bacterium]|nr:sulfatase-like hydrolase/transferase [Planctomycetota bacterium]
MNRSIAFVLGIRVLCLMAVIYLAVGSQEVFAANRPNILFIVGDDMGYADVGFHGCKDIPTPNLDKLASSGVRFTNGYVSGVYCSPTRAGLLTGRYQNRFGHEYNPGGSGTHGLPLSQQTIADRLKVVGYKTGLVGKWHLGSDATLHPQQRGFGEFLGFLGGAHSYFDPVGILRGTKPIGEMDYSTDTFASEAVSFIERYSSEPWFLYLAFNAVHTPMHATDGRFKKFESITDNKRRTYAAMMAAMDDAIGSVLSKLSATKQLENTLICFISDNGGPTMVGTTTNGSQNSPLRGSKRTTLEGGIRVPFLVSFPSQLKPAIYDKPVIQIDLFTTALIAAGATPKPDWKLDGVDLLPHLKGTNSSDPHDALFWRFGQQRAVRSGDWKLVQYDLNADAQTGREKGVTDLKLYNLAKDIHEDRDLAPSMPEKVTELQAKWEKWNSLNETPLWGQGASTEDRPRRKQKK